MAKIILLLTIPIILLPMAFVWYLNIGGLIEWRRSHAVPNMRKEREKVTA